MQRSTLAVIVLTVAAAIAGPAIALDNGAPPGAREARCGADCIAAVAGRGAQGRLRLAAAMRNDPAVAVIVNLRAIERAYRADARTKELPAFYRDLLARTQDPLVRNFINYRLARLEMREDDAKGALDVLMRNLDENLKRL